MARRTLLVSLLLALLWAAPAQAGTGIFVGAAEDEAQSLDPVTAKTKMDLAAVAGLGTIRLTSIWSPGQTIVAGDDLTALRNAAVAARLDGIRIILSVYARDRRTTPLSSSARGQFAQYVASVARLVPEIRDFVIGNEPNLNLFWMPQFGRDGSDLAAASYELLLAKCYDALKDVSPTINVIGGALSPRGQDKPNAPRQTHSPTAFIADLGAAYRRTHRTRPIMDMFAIHPYLIPSRLPPTFAHPRTTTIGIADYPKLVALLTKAFRGTAQPGAALPIVYDELGYQSAIPFAKRRLYSHLGTKTAQDVVTESRQALYYRQAIALAQCQPNVAGLLIFHVTDESDANAWQSGVYYPDGTPKVSMDGVRLAALAAGAGTFAQCDSTKRTDPLAGVAFHAPPTIADPLTVDLECDGACSYTLEVFDAVDGTVAATVSGDGIGTTSASIPPGVVAPGTYQYALRVFAFGQPGTAVARVSAAFAVPPDATPPPDPTAPAVTFPTLTPTVSL